MNGRANVNGEYMATTKKKLSDYTPDNRNLNKGTVRGRGMIQKSLEQYGAGRSILTDRNGRIIGGNKTAEAAAEIGLENVIEVETDGTQIVVVKRTDLDLDDPKAKGLAVADNRTSEVSLDWDAEELARLQLEEPGLLDDWFFEDELDKIIDNAVGGVSFKEYDESIADTVEYHECPECGHKWPK